MKIFDSTRWVAIFVLCCSFVSQSRAEVLKLDASEPPPPAQTEGFHMGTATSPGGHTLTVDSRSLLRDGRPWVVISGEFHFSRCPESEWRDELLKIKAGGVSILTTYIFWIHHEEIEGAWDWTGRRNLRKFLELCHDTGLEVVLRIGPWCHGEARNGGFPDWLQKKGDDKVFELRRDNPDYLGYVQKLYKQIAMQTKGLLWKDGGPVIGVQLENEYSGPTEHLMTLKQMMHAVGIDVPIYTCTGWGSGGQAPFGEMLPLSGAYAEGFWDRSLEKMPGGYGFSFRFSGRRRGNAAAMGAMGSAATNSASEQTRTGVYPFFTCELGGGMMPSYHRRVLTCPEDAESIGLVKLGSGANLLGFYMYHGGENPDGKLTYLNETQATGYWNDLPVKNYDFQAPIGEFGQEREHYHWLRILGLFMQDFGPGLSGMSARMPATRGGLGWAVRSDGVSGYIFVNNYVRLSPQPVRPNVQFQIKLAGGEVTVPSEPVIIPDNSRFIWPLNLDLGGVKLISASAQPICQVDDRTTRYTVFKQTAGMPAEFVFDAATVAVDASTGKQTLIRTFICAMSSLGWAQLFSFTVRTAEITLSSCSTRRRRRPCGKANGTVRNAFSQLEQFFYLAARLCACARKTQGTCPSRYCPRRRNSPSVVILCPARTTDYSAVLRSNSLPVSHCRRSWNPSKPQGLCARFRLPPRFPPDVRAWPCSQKTRISRKRRFGV